MKKFTFLFATLFFAITMFAVNITDGTKLYLKPNNNWKIDNARFAAYFFGGDGELWVSMTDSNNDGVYEVTCQGTRANVIFCRMDPANQENNWNNKWNQTADLTWDGTKSQYNVPESDWDNSGNEYWVEIGNNDTPNNPNRPQGITSYTVCGDFPFLDWETANQANHMTKGTDGIWTKTYENQTLEAKTYQYKVAANDIWDDNQFPQGMVNQEYTINEAGSYNVTFSFNPAKPELICTATKVGNGNNDNPGNDDPEKPQPEVNVYTLCGDFPCFNGDWSPTNTANDMLKGENGIWTKKYENITLEAKKYQYKVAANHSWEIEDYPANGANQEYEITEAGTYNLTFSYNPATPELKCEATKTGDNPGENPGGNDNPTYTLTDGTKLYLNPSEDWKTDGARFAAYFFGGDGELWISMSDSNGDGIYEVTCQGTREKVIFCRMNPANQENNWDNKWNQTSDLTYDGTNNQYNVHGWDAGEWSQFNGNGNGGNGNNGGTDDPEKPQPEADVYTLCGDSIIFGTSWNETDTLNDMTRGEDGIWVKEYSEVTLTKGTYEYKVVASHNWETAGKYPSDDTNMTLYISKEGIYDLKFTFDPTIPELKATATIKVNVENVTINNIFAIDGYVHADTNITIYTITGQDVTSQNGNLSQGIYIIKTQNATSKLIIK